MYALYHLATHHPSALKRWPSAHRLLRPGPAGAGGALSFGAQQLAGQGPDAFAAVGGDRSVDGKSAADDGAPCDDERLSMRLLGAIAKDMGIRKKARGGGYMPDTYQAAQRLLAMVRTGSLGNICFDAHPPMLERKRKQARGLPVVPVVQERSARELALAQGLIFEPNGNANGARRSAPKEAAFDK